MNLQRLNTKIEEARFFLRHMMEEERRISGDKKPFDYYLSAYLSATMSVRGSFYVLQNPERDRVVKCWREAWESNLTQDEWKLYDYMREDRVAEVHKTGSRRSVAQKGVEFPVGTYDTGDSIITVSGSPSVPPLVINKQVYNFTIDGAERKVTDAGAAYLALLERMVAQFEANSP